MNPTVTAVIGIDPGGKSTAIVVLEDGEITRHHTFTRPKDGDLNQYILDTTSAITPIVAEYATPEGGPLVAIEQINKPNPHMGMTNPQGHMDTSRMIGGLVTALTRYTLGPVRMIAPARHGSQPLATYPPELIGPRETGTYGTGKRRHERSAFDIARTARTELTRRVF